MSVEYLQKSMENALSKAVTFPQKAKRDPLASGGGPPSILSESDFGDQFHEDQYEHYRGRFYSAARLITSRISSQPLLVGKRSDNLNENTASYLQAQGYIPPNGIPAWLGDPRKIEITSTHPLDRILRDPNKHQTSHNFWEMISGSLLATGRGFIVCMESERKDRAFDLFPIPATWMKPAAAGYSKWEIKPPGAEGNSIEVDGSMVAHCYFADPSSPYKAISPLTMVARSVLTDEAISASQHSEFINEAMPKVALIAGDVMNETGFTDDPNRTSAARPVRLEPHQRQQIISWFQQQYTGAKKRGLPIVLDAIIRDIKILSRSPEEMGYVSSAALTKEQIFEGIGVSKILTGQLEGVTRASGALAEQFFMDYCFNPILTNISQALTKKLGPLFSVGKEEMLVWFAPGVHRDPEVDIEYLRMGIRSYATTRNDVRRVLNTRFGGFAQLDGFDDVVIPEKLEEREPIEDRLGVGRLATENQIGATNEE